ncbi:hypothetical protein V8C42DRAFT_316336 [Trichoderma barbatum]
MAIVCFVYVFCFCFCFCFCSCFFFILLFHRPLLLLQLRSLSLFPYFPLFFFSFLVSLKIKSFSWYNIGGYLHLSI